MCVNEFFVYLRLQTHSSQIAPRRLVMTTAGWVKCAVCDFNDDHIRDQTYLKHEAFFVSNLQRKTAKPQVVGAILGQLPQETRHALWRGS